MCLCVCVRCICGNYQNGKQTVQSLIVFFCVCVVVVVLLLLFANIRVENKKLWFAMQTENWLFCVCGANIAQMNRFERRYNQIDQPDAQRNAIDSNWCVLQSIGRILAVTIWAQCTLAVHSLLRRALNNMICFINQVTPLFQVCVSVCVCGKHCGGSISK